MSDYVKGEELDSINEDMIKNAMVPGRVWIGTTKQREIEAYVIRHVGKSHVIYTMDFNKETLWTLNGRYRQEDEHCASFYSFVKERKPTHLMVIP